MKDIKITYHGHSMFEIESYSGSRVITDPYNEQIKSVLPDVTADIVLVSHDHYDHSNISIVKGNPRIINNPEPREIYGIIIEGINTFHDTSHGQVRGGNIIFRFIIDEVIFAHMGDIGHIPDADVYEKLKGAEILMIPVGGIYTVSASTAFEIAGKISPAIIIPMHYREKDSKLQVDTVDGFLSRFADFTSSDHSVVVSKGTLTKKTETWVFKSS